MQKTNGACFSDNGRQWNTLVRNHNNSDFSPKQQLKGPKLFDNDSQRFSLVKKWKELTARIDATQKTSMKFRPRWSALSLIEETKLFAIFDRFKMKMFHVFSTSVDSSLL